MMQKPSAVAYIGSVGSDENGKTMERLVRDDGVVPYYHVDSSHATGSCACLTHDKERTFIVNLSAANSYPMNHLLSDPVQKMLDSASVYYATGFFLTVCPEALVHLGEKAAASNKTFMWKISAEFIVTSFWDPFQRVLPYCDILVGNEAEASAFGKKNGWAETDLDEVARKTAALPKVNGKRSRIVIFTQGDKDTIVCDDEGEIKHYPVQHVDSHLIVDTNGAGDTFVGGFLSRLVLGESIEKSVRAGHYCASKGIQVSGAVFQGVPDYP